MSTTTTVQYNINSPIVSINKLVSPRGSNPPQFLEVTLEHHGKNPLRYAALCLIQGIIEIVRLEARDRSHIWCHHEVWMRVPVHHPKACEGQRTSPYGCMDVFESIAVFVNNVTLKRCCLGIGISSTSTSALTLPDYRRFHDGQMKTTPRRVVFFCG